MHPNIENNENNIAQEGELATAPLLGALARPPSGQAEAKNVTAGQANKSARPPRDLMRGTYEQEIARRLGPQGWEMLQRIYEQDGQDYDLICSLQRDGKLSDDDIEQWRFRYGTTFNVPSD